MLAVLNPDRQAWLRHVCRQYSVTFHTPLHVVSELPVEQVLQAWFEHIFDEMPEQQRSEYAEVLSESEEEREKRLAAEKAAEEADDRFLEQLNKDVKADKEKSAKLKAGADKSKKPKLVLPENEENLIDMQFGRNLKDDRFLSSDPLGPMIRKA
jgi:hypothetical protein